MDTEIKSYDVIKVPAGSTANLSCASNDFNHNFMFWLFDKENRVIGPVNEFYNQGKYKYNVLSGSLLIDRVTTSESGFYRCISKALDGKSITVAEVEMLVNGSFTALDAVKLIAIILSILVIMSCIIIYFRLKKEWSKYDGRKMVPVDDIEDDGDEIYNRTTTAISQPVPGPSRNQSSDQLIYGIDNQGLDTDFNSVFENIQIKSPNASLI